MPGRSRLLGPSPSGPPSPPQPCRKMPIIYIHTSLVLEDEPNLVRMIIRGTVGSCFSYSWQSLTWMPLPEGPAGQWEMVFLRERG